jgi:hypothetical protein
MRETAAFNLGIGARACVRECECVSVKRLFDIHLCVVCSSVLQVP